MRLSKTVPGLYIKDFRGRLGLQSDVGIGFLAYDVRVWGLGKAVVVTLKRGRILNTTSVRLDTVVATAAQWYKSVKIVQIIEIGIVKNIDLE